MSKISRSIVVAIFTALILFLTVMDIVYINQNKDVIESTSGLIKFGYFILIFVLVSTYTYVREKLSRLKLQKSVSSLYKYTYITLVMLAATFFKVYKDIDMYPTKTLLLYFALTYMIGLFTQKIIFNVSKSDVLSVLGMFVAFTFPNVIEDKTINLNSKLIALTLLVSIYVMQKLIDELKQLNIKNKKYIRQAVVLGFCIGFSTLCGINYLIWEIVALVSLFITSNLDSTSLNLSGKQKNTIKRRKNNYFIYKVERIKISKLIVSLVIVATIASSIYFGGRIIVHKLANTGNAVSFNIVNYLTVGIHTQLDLSFSNIKNQIFYFSSMSTRFYMLAYLYILFMEFLSLLLHRKYDTKSTLLKAIFILLVCLVIVFRVDMLYYQPILNLLLVIICIVNTTNIYYNREERIKMIEA